jgi:hypothetical protein
MKLKIHVVISRWVTLGTDVVSARELKETKGLRLLVLWLAEAEAGVRHHEWWAAN